MSVGIGRMVLWGAVGMAGLAVGGWAGYALGRAPLQTELADLRRTHAETGRLQALAAAAELQKAQRRSDELSQRLAAGHRQISNLKRAVHASLDHTTFDRPCLSADAVRVLNGFSTSADMPIASGSAVGADAAVATDTDVSRWIVGARAQYDECRQRLDALIDWHNPLENHLED